MRLVPTILVTCSTIAHADDGNSRDLQIGLAIGGVHAKQASNTSWFLGEVAIAAAFRVSDLLWIRGVAAAGGLSDLDFGGGSLFDARAGAQLRICTSGKVVCGLASVDVGVRHGHVSNEFDHINATSLIIAPQLALDVGTRHFRIRPGIEVDVGTDLTGAALSLSLAYQW
jgi:hypothetical protein